MQLVQLALFWIEADRIVNKDPIPKLNDGSIDDRVRQIAGNFLLCKKICEKYVMSISHPMGADRSPAMSSGEILGMLLLSQMSVVQEIVIPLH
jgi:hypothetical protein